MASKIIECTSAADYALAIQCTRDYVRWLGIDLCFQHIDAEFANFQTMYGLPTGGFILALEGGKIAGGVGVRRFSDSACEMKRMYVYEEFRGRGIGRALATAVVDLGRARGYREMLLDTVARLQAANQLYESLGFVDIPPYRENPDPTVRYMRLSPLQMSGR